ncbi:MAG: TetR/AcrR family transcriptional regulator [Chryseotalea sp.]|jgi:TetR/AcrR family transcriptional repressor of nem operon
MRNPLVTRETILKKAGVLFNTFGYKSTSLSNITDATGLTKGAIYKHFDNKDKLEIETFHYLSGSVLSKLREGTAHETSAVRKLKLILNFFESYTVNPPLKGGCPLLNAAIEADDTNPALRKEAIRLLHHLHESLLEIFNNGIKQGELKPNMDKDHYATLIIANLEGGIMLSKLEGNPVAIKRIIKHLNGLLKEIQV